MACASVRIIAVWRRRSRGTPTWPTSSTCWPTCSSSRAATRSGSSPTAARRSACARRGGSIAQLALEGKAKELSGIGKTIEEKIVQIVEDGRDRGAREARRSGSRPTSSRSCGCPGLGPKTARRIWQELGVDDGRRAEAGGRGRAAAHAHRARPEDGGEHPHGARDAEREGDRAHPARAARCRRCGPSSRCSASIPPPIGSPRRAARAAARDGARPRHHRHGQRPAGADRLLHGLAWVAEVVAKGETKATVVSNDGPPLRPARRAAGVVRQPAPALHRLEGAQRRAARGGGRAAGSRSPSTASRTSRRARCFTARPRRSCTSASATS